MWRPDFTFEMSLKTILDDIDNDKGLCYMSVLSCRLRNRYFLVGDRSRANQTIFFSTKKQQNCLYSFIDNYRKMVLAKIEWWVGSFADRCGSRGSFALLQSLRPGSGFNRSSKLKVRAARGCAASPDTDGLRIPSRVSSVRCAGAGSKLACAAAAVDKRAARAGSASPC